MNSIVCLTQLRRRLVMQKEGCRRVYETRVAEIDKQIGEIDRAINYIDEAVKPYACPHCGGTGSIRVPDAAGQCEDVICRVCNGTGFKFDESKTD